MSDSHVIVWTEIVRPAPAVALARLLDVAPPNLERDGLPLLWHWLYLLECPHQADLGADGHPVRGVIPTPPEPGRRRMWAGGRVTRLRPLMLDREATRRSEITSVADKEGRSGRLTFVTVRHTITQAEDVAVVEEQDVVYRDAARPGPGSESAARTFVPQPPERKEWEEWEVETDPTLLFRFSALTYNAHRIHYDRDYARDVEGYAGLVTHGPLQALLMAEAVRRSGRRAAAIEYKLVAPLLAHEGLVVGARPGEPNWDTRIRDHGGRLTATGYIRLNP
ncbi:MaoC family dehydratase N-terminal domain-containing protein [Acrocarpospora sp. B8E8]|uniref:FAS1-like dehydratase domain-containing protein n=1 Tax=Acrocarpospora sp. B8E8 TaxID=3153572 RepID=UPI00325C9624